MSSNSNDVFGTENFDDLLAAVDSLEDFSEDSPPLLENPAEISNESANERVFISDTDFHDLKDSAEETTADSLFSTSGYIAAEDELYDEFDGFDAATEIHSVLHDEQSAEPVHTVSGYADQLQKTPAEDLFPAREVSKDIKQPNRDQSSKSAESPIAAFLENPSWVPKQKNINLFSFYKRFPILYFGGSALVALLGFAYILMFPALFVFATYNSIEMLNSPFASNTVMLILAFFSISLFLFLISYKLLDLQFLIPEGIEPDEKNAGPLLEKLNELKKQQCIPKIHQVVLTRRHEVNVIKVPRFGLPLWSKNVLAIGFPLLQTLSPEHFDSALSRRLLQYSKRRNLIVNWLNFMRRTWTLYAQSLKQRNGVIDLLHYCFFAPYASFYRNFAVYATQKDELMADEMALTICNDRDLLKGAQTIRITQAMLIQYFWPMLNEAIKANHSAPAHIRPYYNLPGSLKQLLESENIDSWFIRLSQEAKNESNAEAPFAKRMEVLGHCKVSTPKAFEVSAANHYFADQYDVITDEMDALWASEVNKAMLLENLEAEENEMFLPFRLSIEAA